MLHVPRIEQFAANGEVTTRTRVSALVLLFLRKIATDKLYHSNVPHGFPSLATSQDIEAVQVEAVRLTSF